MKDEDRKLWTDRINDYRSSGLTAVQWAENRGIGVYKLRYYIHKFNKEKKQESKQESNTVQWAALAPKTSKVHNPVDNHLKVTIGKATIEVTPEFDEATFQSIVRILSQC